MYMYIYVYVYLYMYISVQAGIELDDAGNIITDEFQATNIPAVYAVGDVAGKVNLTK